MFGAPQSRPRAFLLLTSDEPLHEFSERNVLLAKLFLAPEFEFATIEALSGLPKALAHPVSEYALMVVYVPTVAVYERHTKDLTALTVKLPFLVILDGITNDTPQVPMLMAPGRSSVANEDAPGAVLLRFLQRIAMLTVGRLGAADGERRDRITLSTADVVKGISSEIALIAPASDAPVKVQLKTFSMGRSISYVSILSIPCATEMAGHRIGEVLAGLLPATGVSLQVLTRVEFRLELERDDILGFVAAVRKACADAGVRAPVINELGDAIFSVHVGPRDRKLFMDVAAAGGPLSTDVAFTSECFSYALDGTWADLCALEMRMRAGTTDPASEMRVEDIILPNQQVAAFEVVSTEPIARRKNTDSVSNTSTSSAPGKAARVVSPPPTSGTTSPVPAPHSATPPAPADAPVGRPQPSPVPVAFVRREEVDELERRIGDMVHERNQAALATINQQTKQALQEAHGRYRAAIVELEGRVNGSFERTEADRLRVRLDELERRVPDECKASDDSRRAGESQLRECIARVQSVEVQAAASTVSERRVQDQLEALRTRVGADMAALREQVATLSLAVESAARVPPPAVVVPPAVEEERAEEVRGLQSSVRSLSMRLDKLPSAPPCQCLSQREVQALIDGALQRQQTRFDRALAEQADRAAVEVSRLQDQLAAQALRLDRDLGAAQRHHDERIGQCQSKMDEIADALGHLSEEPKSNTDTVTRLVKEEVRTALASVYTRKYVDQALTDVMRQIPTRKHVNEASESKLKPVLQTLHTVSSTADGAASAAQKIAHDQRGLEERLRRLEAQSGQRHQAAEGRLSNTSAALETLQLEVRQLGLADRGASEVAGRLAAVEHRLTTEVHQIRQEAVSRDRADVIQLEAQRYADAVAEKLVQSFAVRLGAVEGRIAAGQSSAEDATASLRSDVESLHRQLESVQQSNARPHASPTRTPPRALTHSGAVSLLSPRYEEVELIKTLGQQNASELRDFRGRLRALETAQSDLAAVLANEEEHLQLLSTLDSRLSALELRAMKQSPGTPRK